MAFFVDRKGFVGRGVYKEVLDACRAGLPLWYLSGIDDIIPVHPVVLVIWRSGESWRQFARVNLNLMSEVNHV